jgi:hypothetical protein
MINRRTFLKGIATLCLLPFTKINLPVQRNLQSVLQGGARVGKSASGLVSHRSRGIYAFGSRKDVTIFKGDIVALDKENNVYPAASLYDNNIIGVAAQSYNNKKGIWTSIEVWVSMGSRLRSKQGN